MLLLLDSLDNYLLIDSLGGVLLLDSLDNGSILENLQAIGGARLGKTTPAGLLDNGRRHIDNYPRSDLVKKLNCPGLVPIYKFHVHVTFINVCSYHNL